MTFFRTSTVYRAIFLESKKLKNKLIKLKTEYKELEYKYDLLKEGSDDNGKEKVLCSKKRKNPWNI